MRKIISLALAGAIIMVVGLAPLNRPARADGLPPPPQAYPPPQPSQSCLMTALQLGYQTGRREVAYAATEACLLFTRSRGAHLPYGYYGPYVPSGYFVPPGGCCRLLDTDCPDRLPLRGTDRRRDRRPCVSHVRHDSVGATSTTFRDANGRITGTVTTDSNGTKTFRDGTGRTTGTATIDANGMTTFRDASGRTTGTASAPRR